MSPHKPVLLPEDVFDDSALDDDKGDQFVHGALADVVVDLLIEGKPPLNIAIFSPWGSGKSSFYTLLKSRLVARGRSTWIVRYDAWKFGGKALKRHFILDVAQHLRLNEGDDLTTTLNHSTESSRLRYGRWVRLNWGSLLFAVLGAFAVAAGWVSVHAWMLADWLEKPLKWKEALAQVLPEAGLVVGLVLAAAIFGPKAMEAAVTKTSRAATDTDEQFSKAFGDLVEQALKAPRVQPKRKRNKLVIYIDELDRCEAPDVVQTLTDLKTFLHNPHVVFVVAADRDALVEALHQHKQATPVRVDAPYYSTPGAFIDKVFQHQVTLPPFRPSALSTYATTLAKAKQSGVWAELRAMSGSSGDTFFRETIYCLVPAHVRSPRRVKVLLNNFATTARMAQSRDIDWKLRAREVAVLTVLNTEFPDVAAAMLRVPQLLKHIRGTEGLPELTLEQAAVVARFTRRTALENATAGTAGGLEPLESEAGPAGALMHGGTDDNDPREKFAQARLNQQLFDYLRKLEKVGEGVPDPRRDLLYLRAIGVDEGITTPGLSDTVDIATDLNPDDVLARFEEPPAPAEDRLAAIAILARQAQEEDSVQKSNVLEVACRLVESLGEHELISRVRADVRPQIFASVGTDIWRPQMTPGAFALATVAHNIEIGDQLIAGLDPKSDRHNELIERCLTHVNWATVPFARSVLSRLAAAAQANPSPLLIGLRTFNAQLANTLWKRARPFITARLVELGEAAEEQQTTTTSGVADDEASEFDSAVHELLVELITAVQHREHPDPDLLSAVLEFAQREDDPETTEWIYDNSTKLFEQLAADSLVVRGHIALGIRYGKPPSWHGWLPEYEEARAAASLATPSPNETQSSTSNPAHGPHTDLDHDTGSSDQNSSEHAVPWASTALVHVVAALPNLEGVELSNSIKVAEALLPDADPEDHEVIVNSVQTALADTAWNEDNRDLRAALWRIAINAPTSDPDDSDQAALVEDLLTGVTDPSASADVKTRIDQMHKLATHLSPAAAGEVSTRLLEDLPAVTTTLQPSALRLAITAGQAAGNPPLTAATFEPLAGTELATAGGAWLATNPPYPEVAKTFGSINYSAFNLENYARRLPAPKRSAFWISAHKQNIAGRNLKAIGKPGLSGVAVEYIHQLVKAETQQTKRGHLVSCLIDGPTLTEDPPHAEATQLALTLFDMNTKGDKKTAMRLIAHSGGAATGSKGKVSEMFKQFLKTKDHGVSLKTQQDLYDLKLAPKPPANGLAGVAKAIANAIVGSNPED